MSPGCSRADKDPQSGLHQGSALPQSPRSIFPSLPGCPPSPLGQSRALLPRHRYEGGPLRSWVAHNLDGSVCYLPLTSERCSRPTAPLSASSSAKTRLILSNNSLSTTRMSVARDAPRCAPSGGRCRKSRPLVPCKKMPRSGPARRRHNARAGSRVPEPRTQKRAQLAFAPLLPRHRMLRQECRDSLRCYLGATAFQ